MQIFYFHLLTTKISPVYQSHSSHSFIQDDDPSNVVAYESFEKMMLRCLMEREYDPDDSETLLAAFRVSSLLDVVFSDLHDCFDTYLVMFVLI